MHLLSLAIGLLYLGIFAEAADNATQSNDTLILTPQVDAFINNVLADWNTAGGAGVAVVRMDGNGGWLIETKGYGAAKADGTKVNPDTIFSLGSNSKAGFFVFGRPKAKIGSAF